MDRQIEDALRRVCELLGIDFAVLWQWSSSVPRVITPTHAYPALSSPQLPEPGTEQHYPWTVQQMAAGRTVVLPSIDDVPADAAVDRESARLAGIQSNVTLPLSVGGDPPLGALALNTLRARRDWPDALVNRLQLVAQVFTNALARRRVDETLRMSEARLASASDLAALAFYEIDYGTDIVYMDDRFSELCGVPSDRREGLGPLAFWIEHLHPGDRQRVLELREKLHGGMVDRIAAVYRYCHPLRGEVWIHHLARVGRHDATGQPTLTFGVLRDVTERKRDEEELRDLSRRLIRAHEEERALLARELHDDVTQRLAVLAIDAARAEGTATSAAQADTMRAIREGLVRLSEDIHMLAYQLHPSVLEELGLAEALRAECERLGRQRRIDISLNLARLPLAIEKEAALCLFRVAQEALNNVIRHAGAHAASVTLRQMDGGLLLAIRDEGIGFDPHHPAKAHSLGLASMRERVRLVDGTVDIESAPGQGTTVVAWVPAHEGSR